MLSVNLRKSSPYVALSELLRHFWLSKAVQHQSNCLDFKEFLMFLGSLITSELKTNEEAAETEEEEALIDDKKRLEIISKSERPTVERLLTLIEFIIGLRQQFDPKNTKYLLQGRDVEIERKFKLA